MTPSNQMVGGLLGLEGGLGQFEVFTVRGKSQIGVGDFGHQQDLRAAAGLVGGEVFLQRPFFRLRIRPKKSISQEVMPKLTLYCSTVVEIPVPERSAANARQCPWR